MRGAVWERGRRARRKKKRRVAEWRWRQRAGCRSVPQCKQRGAMSHHDAAEERHVEGEVEKAGGALVL